MCGIVAVVRAQNLPPFPDWPFWKGSSVQSTDNVLPTADVHPDLQQCLPPLNRRGPDARDIRSVSISPNVTIDTASTLLSMRGAPQTTNNISMPSNQSIVLFNGEIYDGFEDGASGNRCDTQQIHTLIDRAENVEADFFPVLDQLRGPWSIIFWHSGTKRLYFGRDRLGRRSLLISATTNNHVIITSVPPAESRNNFVEFPPVGLAFIDFQNVKNPVFGLHARSPHPVVPSRLQTQDAGTVVAGSAADMYVSFLPSTWLRTTSRQDCKQGKQCRLTLAESANTLISLLRQSVRRRLMTNRAIVQGAPRFALLYSGGIDSMVLARLLDEEIPPAEPLHLINVAFGDNETALNECPDRGTAIEGLHELRALSTSNRTIDLICVDVSTEQARRTLHENVRPLVHPSEQPMDATIGTAIWMAARAQGYVYAPTTCTEGGEKYSSRSVVTSTARIMFSGLGADELMGGYKGRHRTIYRVEGEEGLSREMDADLSRLWFRNLGRDDRLIADHGKEVRHPFLDEDVISFVTSLPLTEHVCDLSKPDGVGDKHLLRRASPLLGLSKMTSTRAKRAIQFGSRSKQVIERK